MTTAAPASLGPRSSAPDHLLHGSAAQRGRRPAGYGFYAHIFLRDLHHLHYAYEPRLTFHSGDHRASETLLLDLLTSFSLYGHGQYDAMTSVHDFVNRVATEHCLYGRCTTEIFVSPASKRDGYRDDLSVNAAASRAAVTPTDESAATTNEAATRSNHFIQLAIIPEWSTRRRWGRLQQLQPHDDSGTLWQTIPRTAVRPVNLPDNLGTRLATTYRRLEAADAYRPGPLTHLAAAASGDYDYDTHQRLANELIGRATRTVGWDGGDALYARSTTAHKNYRRLRFLDTWLTLVQGAVDYLNGVFDDPAIFPDQRFTIGVEGLPSRSRVAEAMRNLVTSTESNDEIFNSVLHPTKFRWTSPRPGETTQ